MIEQEYGIKTKPAYPGNPQTNSTIERIHQVLGNLVRAYNLHEKYVYDAEPRTGILLAATFVVQPTYDTNKENSRPINFWPRHDPPNKSYRELEIYMSA